MKMLYFLLLVVAAFSFSCEDSSEKPEQPDMADVEDKVNTKDTISLEKFNKWKSAWEKNGEAYMDTATLFQYFTLPIVDLKEVLAENATGARYYFGLEKEKGGSHMLKFMLVGTDGKGKDLIDYNSNNYAYDFSRLCPPFCSGGNG